MNKNILLFDKWKIGYGIERIFRFVESNFRRILEVFFDIEFFSFWDVEFRVIFFCFSFIRCFFNEVLR